MEDLRTDRQDYDMEEDLNAQDITKQLKSILGTLEARERRIIELRFGFHGKALTFDQIGSIYDLSRERIRQIQAKALRKLRSAQRVAQIVECLEGKQEKVALNLIQQGKRKEIIADILKYKVLIAAIYR